MRPPLDRLRYALAFELTALALIVPLGAMAFHSPAHDIGVIGLVGSLVATLWNVVYSYVFDRVLLGCRGTTLKTPRLRLVHAVLFELGLLAVLLPFIAWYLGVSLWRALQMDLSLALFFMVYALVFGWVYDRVFPLADWGNRDPGR